MLHCYIGMWLGWEKGNFMMWQCVIEVMSEEKKGQWYIENEIMKQGIYRGSTNQYID